MKILPSEQMQPGEISMGLRAILPHDEQSQGFNCYDYAAMSSREFSDLWRNRFPGEPLACGQALFNEMETEYQVLCLTTLIAIGGTVENVSTMMELRKSLKTDQRAAVRKELKLTVMGSVLDGLGYVPDPKDVELVRAQIAVEELIESDPQASLSDAFVRVDRKKLEGTARFVKGHGTFSDLDRVDMSFYGTKEAVEIIGEVKALTEERRAAKRERALDEALIHASNFYKETQILNDHNLSLSPNAGKLGARVKEYIEMMLTDVRGEQDLSRELQLLIAKMRHTVGPGAIAELTEGLQDFLKQSPF